MSQITISQALRKIKRLKGEMATYKQRVETSVVHDEKKPPAFTYDESYRSYSAASELAVLLESMVAEANATTKVSVTFCKVTSVRSLAWVIRTLQEIKADIALLQGLSSRVAERETDTIYDFEWDNVENKRTRVAISTTYVCALPQAKRAALVEENQKIFEYLNDLLETANHKTLIGADDVAEVTDGA